MNAYADKTKRPQTPAVARRLAEQQNTVRHAAYGSETAVQRKWQEVINNSPRVKQLMAYQSMVDRADSRPVQKKENGNGLPAGLRSGIEALSGYSMHDVKVHYNSEKPAQLQAHAFAQGSDIHIAGGQEKHLPHEAWHVVQQKQGRVKPTMQMKNKLAINDSPGLEREADEMGSKAAKRAYTSPDNEHKLKQTPAGSDAPAQMMWDYNTLVAIATTIGLTLLTIYYLIKKYGFTKTVEVVEKVHNSSDEKTDKKEQVLILLEETETVKKTEEDNDKEIEVDKKTEDTDKKEVETVIKEEETDKKEEITPVIEEESEPLFCATVESKGDDFVVSHKGEILKVKNINFRINVGTKVCYRLSEHPHKMMKGTFFAELVSVGERTPDEGLQGKREIVYKQREKIIQTLNLNKQIEIIGKSGFSPTGARKHYQDHDAIVTCDNDLETCIIQKLGSGDFYIYEASSETDTFCIRMGGKMSILGDIIYTDKTKQSIRKIQTWHAGPSQ
jgi:hypothetical protein